MSLLKKAEITTAYFKCGMLGFQGSGKTFTATKIAEGVCKTIGKMKIAYFDTETGSDFLLENLKAEGIEVFQVKSRAFTDLLTTISDCQKEGVVVLIIDSITHVWRDLCESYQNKLGRKRLQFQDWGIIKKEWGKYTDEFVNSPLHIIVCGRAGFEYDYDFNEDGTKDLIKTGTKMKAESEFGFEPSLVIEMERVQHNREELAQITSKGKRQAFQPKIGSGWIHRAHILKDRTDTMNGQTIDNPTFDDFLPHFQKINIGGQHLGVDTSRTSEGMFSIEGKPNWQKEQEAKEVCLEEIKGTMLKCWPSASQEDKLGKLAFLESVFGTKSWTAVEKKTLDALQSVVDKLQAFEIKFKEGAPVKDTWEAVSQ